MPLKFDIIVVILNVIFAICCHIILVPYRIISTHNIIGWVIILGLIILLYKDVKREK